MSNLITFKRNSWPGRRESRTSTFARCNRTATLGSRTSDQCQKAAPQNTFSGHVWSHLVTFGHVFSFSASDGEKVAAGQMRCPAALQNHFKQMNSNSLQRKTGEAVADSTAFAACLRLKVCPSHRAVIAPTGGSLGAIRRFSAQANCLARASAFESHH